MTTEAEFLAEVKQQILRIDPQAEVWLFGSRVRGNARADSDWDFLVLTAKPADMAFKNQLRDKLYEVELNRNKLIGTVIHSKKDWETDYGVMPLYRNIQRNRRQL